MTRGSGTATKKTGDQQALEAVNGLLNGPETPPPHNCSVSFFMAKMDPALQDALNEAFRRDGIRVTQIHETIKQAGYPVTYGQVTRHCRAIRGTGGTTCLCGEADRDNQA